jgi:hypothetical protein
MMETNDPRKKNHAVCRPQVCGSGLRPQIGMAFWKISFISGNVDGSPLGRRRDCHRIFKNTTFGSD